MRSRVSRAILRLCMRPAGSFASASESIATMDIYPQSTAQTLKPAAFGCPRSSGFSHSLAPPPSRHRGFATWQDTCWSCGAALEGQRQAAFSCPSCRAPQPVPEGLQISAFEVFSRDPSFEIDIGDLDRSFKDLQRLLHPDKFAGAPETEQKIAADLSSLVNASYKVLRDPLQRARLLLRLQGAQTEKDDEKTIEDPELLMEMIEAREEVDEAEGEEQLKALLARNADNVEACVQHLAASFDSGDSRAAIELTQRLTYLMKIQDEIQRKL